MQSKLISKRTQVIVVLIACIFTAALLYSTPQSSIPSSLVIENAAAVPKQAPATPRLPVRLKIPAINIDTTFEYVGLTSGGAMDVPKDPTTVAWYKLGPRPGEIGSAVIAGHYGWKDSLPAVFDNLSKLHKGDKLYVEDEDGATFTFVVSESRIYDPKANATDVFTSNDGKSHLNFVTCEGVWDKTQQSYSKRLVVFTDKEME